MNLKPIIIAGGSGTRLWPLSRTHHPKQFIKLFDGLSLFQKTLVRNKFLGKPTIIIMEDHHFIATEQIREIGIKADLILEPLQKNTAPCAIIASLEAKKYGYKTAILLPADHYIADDEQYFSVINTGLKNVLSVTTIGIRPHYPHTGYGYIKIKEHAKHQLHQVDKFIEKPNLAKAEKYLADGRYFWNSGIFLYDADFMLQQAATLQPELFENVTKSFISSNKDMNFIRLAKEPYEKIEAISVDYAIIEHLSDMIVIEGDFGWRDLGSFNSLWQLGTKDSNNNCLEGDIIISNDVKDSHIQSNNKLTAILGLSNIVVINTDDAVLVADRAKSEELKTITSLLIKSGRKEAKEHVHVARPWGYYQTIDEGELHKVKKIVVRPGEELSLQHYKHRAGYWVVVKGIAEIIAGKRVKKILEHDSIYIPKHTKSRLINIGQIDLHLIAVQTGS